MPTTSSATNAASTGLPSTWPPAITLAPPSLSARPPANAVTAAAVHWGYPYKSRRRLTIVLYGMLYDGQIDRAAHISTFRQVCQLPDELAAASSDKVARRIRTRVLRLRNAIVTAVHGLRPNPPGPRKRVKVFRAPDGRPLNPLEIAAINRPKLLP